MGEERRIRSRVLVGTPDFYSEGTGVYFGPESDCPDESITFASGLQLNAGVVQYNDPSSFYLKSIPKDHSQPLCHSKL
jgi:hypothetical protein